MDTIEESAKMHDISVDWNLAYRELLDIINDKLPGQYSKNISKENLSVEHYGIMKCYPELYFRQFITKILQIIINLNEIDLIFHYIMASILTLF